MHTICPPPRGVGRSLIGGGGEEIGSCLFVLASDGLGLRGGGLRQTLLRGLFLAPPPPPPRIQFLGRGHIRMHAYTRPLRDQFVFTSPAVGDDVGAKSSNRSIADVGVRCTLQFGKEVRAALWLRRSRA